MTGRPIDRVYVRRVLEDGDFAAGPGCADPDNASAQKRPGRDPCGFRPSFAWGRAVGGKIDNGTV